MENTQVLLIPPRQAAVMLSISQRTLADRTKDGTIPSVKLGPRGRRYSVDALKKLIDQQLTASAK
jgi:excisionase family DNA binding protein